MSPHNQSPPYQSFVLGTSKIYLNNIQEYNVTRNHGTDKIVQLILWISSSCANIAAKSDSFNL